MTTVPKRHKQVAQEGIPMRGTIVMTIRDAKTGRVRSTRTIRNKITYLAADVLVELLAQRTTDPAPARDLVYSLRVGSSNTPATRADTNLGAYVFGMAMGDVNKVNGAPGEITFVTTLGAGDANGSTLREAGLFTAGATPSTSDVPGTTPGVTRMIARQIHPDVPKTGGITVDYSWTIAFTATP